MKARLKSHIAFWALALFAIASGFAEETPAAFEEADNPFSGDAPALGEDTYDYFDPAAYAPKSIRIQVEYIEISHKDLTRLMFEEKGNRMDATPLRMKVQALVDKGEGKILETQMASARSGEQATSESIVEYIYPTEYDATPPKPTKEGDEHAAPQAFPIPPGLPTAFETRNVGSTLEVEPTIGENDQMINLRFVPEMVFHTGNTVWQETKDTSGNTHKVQMPDFQVMRTNTALSCISGQYILVTFMTPKDAAGKLDFERKVLLFLKCDVLAAIK